MDNVLLLRSPTSDSPDKYESTFQAAGYHALSVPVLETVLVNQDDLREVVRRGPQEAGLSGVVITSARSSEAWREVVRGLVAQDSTADWTILPFYVVGQATATALGEISKEVGETLLAPHNIRGGSETGTGEKLAHFILEDLKERSNDPPKLLYLTGDKNRDVLPSILRNGGIELQPLQVYKTQGASSFPDGLRDALDTVPDKSLSWWVVYFAPSAADFVTPILRNYLSLPSAESQTYTTKVAAIGPTTSTFLSNDLRLRVDVLSPKPNADSLVLAIQEFDSRRPIV
ncbi:tetrapyrrole biosynthesis uroporphyrinogen III synthase [Irpex lacteus]|nr:tetrapyrrole biosynthesis uroporphyrinogen III synthase [Irpex lacteus]